MDKGNLNKNIIDQLFATMEKMGIDTSKPENITAENIKKASEKRIQFIQELRVKVLDNQRFRDSMKEYFLEKTYNNIRRTA